MPSKLNQNRLHSVIPTPVGKTRKLGWVHYAISWVNARKVDFVDELDGWWLVRILIAAVHLQGVDSILMDTLPYILLVTADMWQRGSWTYVGRTEDCAVPV